MGTCEVTFRQVADTEGRLILIPEAMARALAEAGRDTITLTIKLPARKRMLRLAEAARLHTEDVDGLGYDAARKRIIRACRAGRIEHTKIDGVLYLDPDSLAAWRLKERERNLDRLDAAG